MGNGFFAGRNIFCFALQVVTLIGAVVFVSCKPKDTGYAPDPSLPFVFPTSTTTHLDLGNGQIFNGSSESLQTEISVKAEDTFSLVAVFKANSTSAVGHIIWEGSAAGNGWGNTIAMSDPEMHISIGNVCDYVMSAVNCPGQTSSPQANLLSFFMGDTQQGESNGVLNIAIPFTDINNVHVVQVSVENLSTAPVARMFLDGALVGEDLIGQPARLSRGLWATKMKVAGPGATQRYFSGQVNQVVAVPRATTAEAAAALCKHYSIIYPIVCGN